MIYIVIIFFVLAYILDHLEKAEDDSSGGDKWEY